MRKRDHRIVFYLNDDEFEAFDSNVKQASVSRESFIRDAIKGTTIRANPPVDLHKLIWEIRRVGVNLNEILAIANARGLLDVPQLRNALLDLRDVEKTIIAVFQ